MFIKTKKIYQKNKKFHHDDEGLTLVESLVSLTIFTIVAAIMMPFFANQRLNVINNELQTGAVAVSQHILDRLRLADIATLPSSGTATTLPLLLGQTTADTTNLTKMGKNYSATIFYCPITPTDDYCNSNARHIKVEVSYNGQIIYTAETVYTRLQ